MTYSSLDHVSGLAWTGSQFSGSTLTADITYNRQNILVSRAPTHNELESSRLCSQHHQAVFAYADMATSDPISAVLTQAGMACKSKVQKMRTQETMGMTHWVYLLGA